jgi:hypothetical protein
MSKPDVQSVFKAELSLIEHAPIRNFVITAFNQNCPGYFWYIPASVKGHHPPICRQVGGLVHHTKLAVEFASAFNEMTERDVSTVTEDMVIASVMLHDMLKRGETDDELDTFNDHREALGNHGRYCAKQLEYLEDSLPGFGFHILAAVKLHMGRWTGDVQKWELQRLEDDEVVRGCHLADYAASRALHNFLGARASDPGMAYLQRATEQLTEITCVQCGEMITRVEFYVDGCPKCGE